MKNFTVSDLHQLEKIRNFIVLLGEKNKGLNMSLGLSFEELPESYKEGKFVASAHKHQKGENVFILKVDRDFDLPYEYFFERDLECSSWRNNDVSCYLDDDLKLEEVKKMPEDFDVVTFQGNMKNNLDSSVTYLYVVGGCANSIEETQTYKR